MSLREGLLKLDKKRREIKKEQELRRERGLAITDEQLEHLARIFFYVLNHKEEILGSRKRQLTEGRLPDLLGDIGYHFTVKCHQFNYVLNADLPGKLGVLTHLHEQLVRLDHSQLLQSQSVEAVTDERPTDWRAIWQFFLDFDKQYAKKNYSGLLWLERKLTNKSKTSGEERKNPSDVTSTTHSRTPEVRRRRRGSGRSEKLVEAVQTALKGVVNAEAESELVLPPNEVKKLVPWINGGKPIKLNRLPDSEGVYYGVCLHKQLAVSMKSIQLNILQKIVESFVAVIPAMLANKQNAIIEKTEERQTLWKFRLSKKYRYIVVRGSYQNKQVFLLVAVFIKSDQKKVHKVMGVYDR